jgi:limonene-1,2-epoxide hydrolase
MQRSKHRMTRRVFGVGGAMALGSRGLSALVFGQQADVGKPVGPEAEKSNVAVVNDFCAAFAKKDLAKITSLLADDCMYRVSQTRPPMTGKQAVADFFKPVMDRGQIEFRVRKTVVLGPVVLNERDDLLPASATQPARLLRIHAGLFFVQDGKIQEWTDYILR